MNVTVADTSVLIDLERGGFLEMCFSLPFQFTVPDLLYRNELAARRGGPEFGESLLALGLRVEELDGSEVGDAILYRRERPSLSLPDAFALALAAGRDWTLLTGDGVLRAFAVKLSVVCHGVLWILDQMLDNGVSSPECLLSGLSTIRDHPRCRLPQDEIAKRIAVYTSMAETS